MALTAQILPVDTVMTPVHHVATAAADTLTPDSVTMDSPVADTVWYIMLDPPASPELPGHVVPETDTTGMSWILTALLALFVIVAIRFRNNSKYLGAMFRDAVEVRERGNVFDETVREESFIVILNVLWCISVGVLLYTLVDWSVTDTSVATLLKRHGFSGLPPGGFPEAVRPLGMAICTLVVVAWQLLMVTLYTVVGNVFNDTTHTRMWVTGYLATTGLSTLVFFPLSLLAICYPEKITLILWIALGGFIVAKLIFIWKGFRIFFREIASWLLFLYYLCSLEIVPLILLYVSTMMLCATIL